VARDEDFLASLHAIKQGSQRILGFERPNLVHDILPFNPD
jgi:hypothetical protein